MIEKKSTSEEIETIIKTCVEIKEKPEIMNKIVKKLLEIEIQINEPPDIEANTNLHYV